MVQRLVFVSMNRANDQELTCCAVGKHREIAEINRLLSEPDGPGLTVIGSRFRLAKSSLSVHRSKCLGLGSPRSVPVTDRSVQLTESAIDSAEKVRSASTTNISPAQKYVLSTYSNPDNCDTTEERSRHVAWLLSDGKWTGVKSAVPLCVKWNCGLSRIWDYHRAGAVICQASHGEIAHHRQESIGHWTAIRDAAMEKEDLKAAALAQKGLDTAAGVSDTKMAKVEININRETEFVRFVMQTLEPYPEALEALVRAMRGRAAGTVIEVAA
jgi:hypothetical protein